MDKSILAFLFCFFLSAVMPVNASVEQDAYELFQQGLELEKTLRVFPAKDRFRDAIATDPANAGYLEHYAWFLHYHGFSEEAVSIFERLLPLKEDKNPLYMGLAWNERKIGKLRSSLINYHKVLDFTYPADRFGQAFEDIKWGLQETNKDKIKTLIYGLEKEPNDLDMKKELFSTYMYQGDLACAEELGEEIFSQDSTDMFLRLQFARMLNWKGDTLRSERIYRELINASPDSAFFLFELGIMLAEKGRIDEARDLLDKAFRLYPSSPRIQRGLAEVYIELGRESDALLLSKNIDTRGSDTISGVLANARALHRTGETKRALELYLTLLHTYEYNIDALSGVIETAGEMGSYKDLRWAVKRWEETVPDDRTKQRYKLFSYRLPPKFSLKADYYDNSSEFSRENVGLEYDFYMKKNTRLKLGYSISEFQEDGFSDIFRQSFYGEFSRLFNDNFQILGRLAGNFYDTDNRNLNGKISVEASPFNRLTTVLSYSHFDIIDTELPFGNPIYNHVVVIGAAGLNIRTDDTSAYLLYEITPRTSISGQFIHGRYSDSNTKTASLFEVVHKLNNVPFFKVAYDYFYLDLADPAPVFRQNIKNESAYYDPINFEAHTLRYEYERNAGESMSLGSQGAISHVVKSDGISASLFLFLQYDLNDWNIFRIDTRGFYQNRGVDRTGETGHFWARNILFTYTYAF